MAWRWAKGLGRVTVRPGGATAGAAQVLCAAGGGGVGVWPGAIISLSGDTSPRDMRPFCSRDIFGIAGNGFI
ncbi:hypothetical protein, partial [Klebsiella michiganensis]|uniref:hypothetical protein n=1 Tax=Klebsiella michiganensis TaxID=1134687 RepID=UPI001C6E24AF